LHLQNADHNRTGNNLKRYRARAMIDVNDHQLLQSPLSRHLRLCSHNNPAVSKPMNGATVKNRR
jgi:hypothetical protein